jgi:hypothetical protein
MFFISQLSDFSQFSQVHVLHLNEDGPKRQDPADHNGERRVVEPRLLRDLSGDLISADGEIHGLFAEAKVWNNF